MKDEKKTKEQLVEELTNVREKVTQLENEQSGAHGKEKLQRHTDYLKVLMENTSDFIMIADAQGLPVVFNQAYADIIKHALGIDMKPGIQPHALLEDKEAIVFWEGLHKRVLGGENFSIEFPFAFGDDIRDFEFTFNPITDESGAVVGFSEVSRDITDRKQTEKILAESEEKFRRLSESSPMGVFQTGREGDVVYLNDRWCSIAGMAREDAMGFGWVQALHPDDKPLALADWEICLKEKKGYAGEFRFVHPTGEIHWVYTKTSPIFSTDGEVLGHVGANEDITARKNAERVLIEEKEFTEAALNAQNDTFFVFEPDTGKAIRWNEAFSKISGYSDEEIARLKAPDTYYSPEDLSEAARKTEAVLKGKQVTFEMEIITKDGRRIPTEYSASAILDEKGHPKYIISVGRDISERKRAEKELQESERRYRLLIENTPIVAWISDAKGKTSYISPNVEKVYGYSPDEIIAAGEEIWFGRMHQEDKDRVMEAYQNLFSERKPYDVEYRIQRKNGEWIWLYDRANIVIDKEGVACAYGIFSDITEVKRGDNALRESEYWLKNAQSIAKIGHWRLNPATGEITGSDELFRIFSLRREEATLDSFAGAVHPEDREYDLSHIRRGIEYGESWDIEHRLLDKDGKVKYVHAIGEAFTDETGKTVSLVGTVQDITERKKEEEEKTKLERRLRQSEKMESIGQLAGGIAHDFNNQLAGILGYADLLREEVGHDKDLTRYTDNILLGVKRAADLTTQLLAFSRQGKYQSIPVNFHRIVFEVVNILGHSIDKRIKIRQELNANPATTLGDPTQLQNAVLNLALNARDAMPDGGELTFLTDVVDLDEEYCKNHPYAITPGKYLKIGVTDSGLGMDKETSQRIFEPFFTTKEQGKGTGMGLAAVYGTVKNHKGAINVYSEPDHGTTFSVYLPLLSEEEPGIVEEQVIASSAKGTGHILLVEDEVVFRDAATEILEKLGYQVTVCGNGKDAVEFYTKSWQSVDLVIIDMVMPVMNGKDAFIAMRDINPAIVAILATGYSLNGEAKSIIDEGVKGFIQKPFRRNDLSQKIAEVLNFKQ